MPIYFLFALTAFHETCWAVARVVLVLYAVELGAQPFAIGMLAATFSVFPMLLAVQGGRLVDRIGARWPMLSGSALGVSGALTLYFLPGLPVIFIGAALIGIFDTIYVVSLQSLIGVMSDAQNRARNYSNYTLILSATGLVGPLFAGYSIDHSGYAAACLYLALLMTGPIVMLVLRGDAPRAGQARVAQAQGGAMAMLAQPGVRKVLIISSTMSAGSSLYQFYMPVYSHSVGLSASIIGIVLAMNATGSFTARSILPYAIARYKEEKVLACALFFGAAGLILIPLFKGAAMLGLISFLFGLGMGCSGPLVMMLMFANSAEGRSGEGLGLKMTVNHMTKMISPVVFGAMGSAFGLFPMFCINGLMMGSVGLLNRRKK